MQLMPTDAQKLQRFTEAVGMLGRTKAADYPRRCFLNLHDACVWLMQEFGKVDSA